MYCKTIGPVGAKLFICGEAPGKDEEPVGRPFQGYAGHTLDWLLSQSGINRPECLIGNVARERPPANKISYFFEDKKCTIPKPEMVKWMGELHDELTKYRPNLVVAAGATALWALTGLKKISSYRGYILPSTFVEGMKVLPIYHPAAIGRDWKLHFMTILDLKKAAFHKNFPSIPEYKTMLVDNAPYEQFIQYCREILSNPKLDKVCVDVETVQPGSHIAILGFAHSPYFGISTRILNGRTPALTLQQEKELWYWAGRVMTEKQIIIQNATYDVSVAFLNNGILMKNVWMDTLLAGHVCYPELPRDLGFLASILLDVPPWKLTSSENGSLYNAKDCAHTFGVALRLDGELDRLGVRKTFDFEMSQLPLATMLQLQGVEVNTKRRDELVAETNADAKKTGDALLEIVKHPININSPKQMKQLLYGDMGLPVQYKKRKSATDPRVISCDKKALTRLIKLVPDNPIFNLFLEHRRELKLLNFLEVPLSPSNKVHTSYNITGSKADDGNDEEQRKSFGRWSSSKSIILPYGSGNQQNIPEFARKMYMAPPGYKYLCADYVQAEAVVVAYLINDQKAKTLFEQRRLAPYSEKSNFDIHNLTAAMMFGLTIDKVTKDLRKIGKRIRHGGNYDAGPQAISDTLGCSLREAAKLKEVYHRTTPQLRLWYQQIQSQLHQNMTLTTPLGRVHRFLDQWGDNLFRSAYSFKPQSTVGDMMNQSLVQLYNECGDWLWMVLQLHDGIYSIVKEEDIPRAVNEMKRIMVWPIEVNHEQMIIEIDFKVGNSWGDMEDFNDEKMEMAT